MGKTFVIARLALGLAFISCALSYSARSFGLIPDRREMVVQGRLELCEALAVHASSLSQRHDSKKLQASLDTIVKHNPQILSAALRRADGRLLVAAGNHASQWEPDQNLRSSDSQMAIPIHSASRRHPSFQSA